MRLPCLSHSSYRSAFCCCEVLKFNLLCRCSHELSSGERTEKILVKTHTSFMFQAGSATSLHAEQYKATFTIVARSQTLAGVRLRETVRIPLPTSIKLAHEL